MSQTIKASERNLAAVFSSRYLYTIPLYQRPYAWTTEEADELLDDLLAAQRQNPSVPYFLGSIVLIKDEGNPQSEVVDGQQRLTTLAIILCALRDLSDDEELRDDVDNRIREKGSLMEGTPSQFRLSLRPRDRQFFNHNIQRKGATLELLDTQPAASTDSQQEIVTNAKQIGEQLRDISEAERRSLVEFLGTRCYLVVVAATDRDSAYRIFSVMNDRGLDLSPTDILKAETIGRMQEEVQATYGERWENLEQELGRDDFRNLFTYIRMIRLKSKMRQALQTDFQDYIFQDISGEKFIEEELEPYADVYQKVKRDSNHHLEQGAKIDTYLGYLRRLDNADWIPPAMAFFHQNLHDGPQLAQFTKELERLAYGLYIIRANITERITRYARVLRTIEKRGDLFHNDSSLQLTDIEKIAIRQQLNGAIYVEGPVIIRLVLQRLDSLLSEAHATYRHDGITVEHVLPQNPRSDSQWMDWFPFEEERQYWTHRLANLVLLSHRKNSQASNWDFEEKKQRYFYRDNVSTFALTSQVIAETEWTPDVLERRQKNLVDALRTEWRLG